MGGSHWTGVEEFWNICPQHKKQERLKRLKKRLEESREQMRENKRVVRTYPVLIKELEAELDRELPLDETIILDKTKEHYLH